VQGEGKNDGFDVAVPDKLLCNLTRYSNKKSQNHRAEHQGEGGKDQQERNRELNNNDEY